MAEVVAILGGSSAWTPLLARALAKQAAMPLEVRLLGRDGARTHAVAQVCDAQARRLGAPHRWRAHDDVTTAAAGARVVVNQMRIGGFAARTEDEALPLRYDLPGDETIGVGGLSAAMRSVVPTLAAAAKVAAVAKDCWFVNMANPMGILAHALARAQPALRCIGLCELPEVTLHAGLRLLDLRPHDLDAAAPEQASLDYVGINHQGFFCRAMARGVDQVPAILQAIAAREPADAPLSPFQVRAAAMREFDALPLPYLRLYVHADRAVAAAKQSSRGATLGALAERLHASYRDDPGADLPAWLAQRPTPWLELALAPALTALLGGAPATLYVSAHNRGSLPFLPDDTIVEQRAEVSAAGITPRPPSAVSLTHPRRNALLRAVATFERAAADAALAPSEGRVRRALDAHPSSAALPAKRREALCAELLQMHHAASHREAAP